MATLKKSSEKIVPCLWFDMNAGEAVKFYTGIFKKSKIINTTYYGDYMPKLAGQILTINFELEGQSYLALNGGPGFPFSEAVSLMVMCKNQDEIDYYWKKLSKGGKIVQCGWLIDKFGFRWQVCPEKFDQWIATKDPARADRVMRAMMKMKKLNWKTLQKAYVGK